MYGYICPDCGCHLDPQEKCDCREEREQKREKAAVFSKRMESMIRVGEDGQMQLVFE